MANDKGILNLRFNQDQGCFSCCLNTGLKIYNADPFVEKANYNNDSIGQIQKCEMLFRTNLLVVIGGVYNDKYPPHTLLIYDDCTKQYVSKINFPSNVHSVRVRRDKLFVVLRNKIHVFTFPPPHKLLFTVETRENKYGLIEVSPIITAVRSLLVFPALKMGYIQIQDLGNFDANTSSAPLAFKAHESELACLAINQQGTLLATASEKGTVIRIWETLNKSPLYQYRRGTDQAVLYCLNFSPDSEYLCCSSDKGTIHVFAVKDPTLNRESTLSKIGIKSKYSSPTYGFANFTVPAECPCLCAFGSSKSTVIVICCDGSYYKYRFNSSGFCSRVLYDVFGGDSQNALLN